ncbi:MAG: GGDEF domain-containing protein [Gammaproteobacteria bacterium]|nr:MAG: GGDEF domain-containing protein [Gammaproteobacteria bacterium]
MANQQSAKYLFWNKLLLCVLVTVIAMYSHRFFPEKHLKIAPSKDANFWLYGDTNSSGQTAVQWTNKEELAWMCNIEVDGNDHHICGFGISIGGGIGTEGTDLSGYDRLKFDMEYEGSDQRIRIYIRNYLKGFSDINAVESQQFINLLIPTNELGKSLTIDFSKFMVAEWWISAYNAPLQLMYPSLKNVTVLGVDLHYPSTPGKHYYKLKNLEVVGLWISVEKWYLSILIFWIIVILVNGAISFWQFKRKFETEHQQLEELKVSSSTLENESKHYRQLSITDQLTGLMSRHGLNEFIEHYFPTASPQKLSIMIADIDFFKTINDKYGHVYGDLVLKTIGSTIQATIASNDVAARWGGEEFVILSFDVGQTDVLEQAEKIRIAVENLEFSEIPGMHTSISIGVGILKESESFLRLFERTDAALYQAKNNGRNQVSFAED